MSGRKAYKVPNKHSIPMLIRELYLGVARKEAPELIEMRVDPSPPPLLGLLVILQRGNRPVLRGRRVRQEVCGGLERAVAEIRGAAAEALLDEPRGEELVLLAPHGEAAVGGDVDEARPGEELVEGRALRRAILLHDGGVEWWWWWWGWL